MGSSSGAQVIEGETFKMTISLTVTGSLLLSSDHASPLTNCRNQICSFDLPSREQSGYNTAESLRYLRRRCDEKSFPHARNADTKRRVWCTDNLARWHGPDLISTACTSSTWNIYMVRWQETLDLFVSHEPFLPLPSCAMQAQTTRNAIQSISATQSISAVQTLLRAGLSCIAFLRYVLLIHEITRGHPSPCRNLLPEDNFSESMSFSIPLVWVETYSDQATSQPPMTLMAHSLSQATLQVTRGKLMDLESWLFILRSL